MPFGRKAEYTNQMIPPLCSLTPYGEPCSFLSGRTDWIERHHCFDGQNRKASEKYGLCVFLNHYEHNENPYGVHHNRAMMEMLQDKVQRIAMEYYGWTMADWMNIFHRNFLK